jgi:hypothetical protein
MSEQVKHQVVDLYAPIMASRRGNAPLVIRVGVAPESVMTVTGPTSAPVKAEAYVLLSALPEDLRRRVETAIQVMIQGM